MEYTVNSLKDAIIVSLNRLGYDENNIDIIKKLIINAIEGKANYFTRTNGAREYIKSKNVKGILKEMIDSTKTISNNTEEIINKYIDKCFKKKKDNALIEDIHNNSDLNKVIQKIRYLSTSSVNDQEFIQSVWDTFSNIFIGKDKTISKEEIRYDMLEAALKQVKKYRGQASVLKNIDIKSTNINEFDALKLVEEYVYANNIEDLMVAINHNQILSGLLLQNLIDYTYFKKQEEIENFSLNELDKLLNNIPNLNDRASILLKILNREKVENFKMEREKLIILLLKNSLLLNIYTTNRNSMDYTERKLYSGNSEIDNETIERRIIKNNDLINNFLLNGLNIEDISNFIVNLTDIDLYFLSNIYVISRSLNENKESIDNAIYKGSKEKIMAIGLLEENKLMEILKEKQSYKH